MLSQLGSSATFALQPMRFRTLRLALAPALVTALAGCGETTSSESMSLAQVPLVNGASIATQARQCDRGANAFCAIEAVVIGPRFSSSGALAESERRHLRKLGWAGAAGDNGKERAALSPGHKLRVTYATAIGDLIGIDLGWIKRPWTIGWSLHLALINQTPAISIMLEAGPA
jgi:hypothetical protein